MRRGPVLEVRCDEKAPVQAPTVHSGVSEVQVESSEARAARLLNLRHAIASGTYKIPAGSVANKVIDRMRSHSRPGPAASIETTSTGARGQSVVAARRSVEPSNS